MIDRKDPRMFATDPVPQSKAPPNGEHGYSTTVWLNGVMLKQLGGRTYEEAVAAAEEWIMEHENPRIEVSEPVRTHEGDCCMACDSPSSPFRFSTLFGRCCCKTSSLTTHRDLF